MLLQPGTTFGPYQVLAPLGAGGMGEVYRARDTRLGRTVALKIVSQDWRERPDLRRRFKVEAEAIAALGHPHICQLFDVGQHEDIDFIVMEYLEGETLAARLARGRLPISQALEYAGAIADALGHAHRRGIVHRDVKPANVILTKEGLKLLDFGLALVTERPIISVAGASTVAAGAGPLTQTGAALGTWQYMAPEQVRGGPVDARSDVFALGAVIYEMLAGARAFAGPSHHELVTAILNADPVDLRTLNPAVEPAVAHIVRTALAKEPDDRWQDARDLKRAIDAATVSPGALTGVPARPARSAWVALSILVAVALMAAVWALVGRPQPPAARSLTRLSMPVSGSEPYFGSLALTPDGRTLVYRVGQPGNNRLDVRPMDQLEASPLAATGGGFDPFFSPDGQWMGFAANRRLKKIRLAGGASVELCEVRVGTIGSTWGPDGTIVFADQGGRGLMRVSAEGGTPQTVTTRAPSERAHRNPQFLPDGKALLFTVTTTETVAYDQARIELLELATGARRVVLTGARWARYVATGHLVFARAGELFAARFDSEQRRITGDPVRIASSVWMEGFVVHAALSDTGELVYVPSKLPPENTRRLVWLNRRGEIQPDRSEPGYYLSPRISSDGRQVVLAQQRPSNTLWVFELNRGTLSRVTSQGDVISPAWMPDNRTVVYSASWQQGGDKLVMAAIDSSDEHVVFESFLPLAPETVSPDGTLVITSLISPTTRSDLWAIPVAPSHKPWPLLQSPAEEYGARLSPDGKWLAYASNEAGLGLNEVYVRPFPGLGGRVQISTKGGRAIAWAASGREIFYRERDRIMAVKVQPGPPFVAASPEPLFTLPGRFHDDFDVTSDGQRFLMVQEIADQPVSQFNVVLNWIQGAPQGAAER